MSKSTTGRTVWYALLAVVAAIVALNTWHGFAPGSDDYTPTCDHRSMQRGDTCISSGSGGGDYDEMLNRHYHDDQIAFCVSLPLTILFTGLSIRTGRYNRQARKARSPRP